MELTKELPAERLPGDRIVAKHRTIYSSLPLQIYMIHAIKTPMMDSVNTLFRFDFHLIKKLRAVKQFRTACRAIEKMPEPTLENTWHPNTHNLIILRNSLNRHWFIGWLLKMSPVKQLVDFSIIVYDFDPPWRWIIDGVKDRLLAEDWTLRNLLQTRDWLYGCLTLNDTRMKFIRRVMNLAIVLYFTPCRLVINVIKDKAFTMKWEKRGFEDTWSAKYTWWKEDANKPAQR